MASNKLAFAALHFIKKLPFNAVDVVHWPTMDDWQLPFLVNPHLESFLHFFVTPEENYFVICKYC
jgi:hypothetical protein